MGNVQVQTEALSHLQIGPGIYMVTTGETGVTICDCWGIVS
jgi:hypothetical protein